jgi:hypothetical protein
VTIWGQKRRNFKLISHSTKAMWQVIQRGIDWRWMGHGVTQKMGLTNQLEQVPNKQE